MELKKLSNEELLKIARNKSKAEKVLTLEVIHLIKEIDRRRLFLNLGFGSLFDYVKTELGYEESAALRRIATARLIKEMPELEQKVSEGKLTLSNMAQAQVFFRKEQKLKNRKLTTYEKSEVLEMLENKSTREAQKTLLELSPETITLNESSRQITAEHTELKIVIDENLRNKLEHLKSRLSHKKPGMSYAELIHLLSDMALKKLDPEPPKSTINNSDHRPSLLGPSRNFSPEGARSGMAELREGKNKDVLPTVPSAPTVQNGTRYIPAQLKKQIWLRDQCCCSFVDPGTGRKCASKFQLEIHHLQPYSMGGETTLENLKLVCKRHNTFFAVKDFGHEKMSGFTICT